jgi:hypothetical protein
MFSGLLSRWITFFGLGGGEDMGGAAGDAEASSITAHYAAGEDHPWRADRRVVGNSSTDVLV